MTQQSKDIEDLVLDKPFSLSEEDRSKYESIVKDMLDAFGNNLINNTADYQTFIVQTRRKHRVNPSKVNLLYIYRNMAREGKISPDSRILPFIRRKQVRGSSGVIVVTVFTASHYKITGDAITPSLPKTDSEIESVTEMNDKSHTFSCKYNCHYCPAEPGQPRSYLKEEPGVRRANAHDFVAVEQFWNRLYSLFLMGQAPDKIEVLVLGGTFSSYPLDYQFEFIRDIYYAANTFYDKYGSNADNMRPRMTLDEEVLLNVTSNCHIIGLTLETRPDCVNKTEIMKFRRFGVTRLQIGIQHTDDRILQTINRRCMTKHAKRAIKMLKDLCYKIDIHLMPDLPPPLKEGINHNAKILSKDDFEDLTLTERVEIDRKMFDTVLNDPDLQVDQWKIYPCEVVPWTTIKDWYDRGLYVPYAEVKTDDGKNPLFELIMDVKMKVHPWIRLNRVIRDIPEMYIEGGNNCVHMRDLLQKELVKRGKYCACIRCREVGLKKVKKNEAELKYRIYEASEGLEYFLSFETGDEKNIFGFLRLRLTDNAGYIGKKLVFPELEGAALIRELHVYGQAVPVGSDSELKVQHYGFGRRLLEEAEKIAKDEGYEKIAVISGVGVRNYYAKFGYVLTGVGQYMIKTF